METSLMASKQLAEILQELINIESELKEKLSAFLLISDEKFWNEIALIEGKRQECVRRLSFLKKEKDIDPSLFNRCKTKNEEIEKVRDKFQNKLSGQYKKLKSEIIALKFNFEDGNLIGFEKFYKDLGHWKNHFESFYKIRGLPRNYEKILEWYNELKNQYLGKLDSPLKKKLKAFSKAVHSENFYDKPIEELEKFQSSFYKLKQIATHASEFIKDNEFKNLIIDYGRVENIFFKIFREPLDEQYKILIQKIENYDEGTYEFTEEKLESFEQIKKELEKWDDRASELTKVLSEDIEFQNLYMAYNQLREDFFNIYCGPLNEELEQWSKELDNQSIKEMDIRSLEELNDAFNEWKVKTKVLDEILNNEKIYQTLKSRFLKFRKNFIDSIYNYLDQQLKYLAENLENEKLNFDDLKDLGRKFRQWKQNVDAFQELLKDEFPSRRLKEEYNEVFSYFQDSQKNLSLVYALQQTLTTPLVKEFREIKTSTNKSMIVGALGIVVFIGIAFFATQFQIGDWINQSNKLLEKGQNSVIAELQSLSNKISELSLTASSKFQESGISLPNEETLASVPNSEENFSQKKKLKPHL